MCVPEHATADLVVLVKILCWESRPRHLSLTSLFDVNDFSRHNIFIEISSIKLRSFSTKQKQKLNNDAVSSLTYCWIQVGCRLYKMQIASPVFYSANTSSSKVPFSFSVVSVLRFQFFFTKMPRKDSVVFAFLSSSIIWIMTITAGPVMKCCHNDFWMI